MALQDLDSAMNRDMKTVSIEDARDPRPMNVQHSVNYSTNQTP